MVEADRLGKRLAIVWSLPSGAELALQRYLIASVDSASKWRVWNLLVTVIVESRGRPKCRSYNASVAQRKYSVSGSYSYHDYGVPDPPHETLYLAKVVNLLHTAGAMTILDAGCGDGSFTASLAKAGFRVYGLDLSEGGIERARDMYPSMPFATGSVYDDLRKVFDGVTRFDAVVAVEVIEHLYSPATFVNRINESLRPGGLAVVTTPYWGYFKNVGLALTNRIDRSLTALWEGGHIKHWSRRTLTTLFEQHGFKVTYFSGAGRRIPFLWNGMVMAFQKRPR